MNMSDGGEEKKRESEYNESRVRVGTDDFGLARAGRDDYCRALARVAVAQICEGVGFNCAKESALLALSDVAVRFMRDIGKSASSCACLAGRTECNVFHIVRALEDMSSIIGFRGASEVECCPVVSGVVKELVEFVETAEEIPFARPVTQFPVIKSRRGIPSFSQIGEAPSGDHVPDWLPAFPDQHTYAHSPVLDVRGTDRRVGKLEQARQRRKAEGSLLNLQQRLHSSSNAGPSGSTNHAAEPQEVRVGHADEPKGSLTAVSPDLFFVPAVDAVNPFLAPPLPAGEKDVATIVSPGRLRGKEDVHKNPGSVLDIFAPAVEAMESGVAESSMDSERRALPDRRPVVSFTLKGSRKMTGGDLDSLLGDRLSPRNPFLSAREDENDEKKRRAG
ncbi:hypothetical protein Drorol1_Dr00026210 [Drosera rotundifolia]